MPHLHASLLGCALVTIGCVAEMEDLDQGEDAGDDAGDLATATSELASNCTVYEPGIAHPPNTSNNWYREIDTSGTVIRSHGVGYYPLSMTNSWLGMEDRDGWMGATEHNQPIYPPTNDPDVQVTTGWIYGSGSSHNAFDYSGGGIFTVNAVADGVVLWKGYMASPGNVVIIEHTAPDGTTFRTLYHHLIDGRDHDIALARATTAWCAPNCAQAFLSYQARADQAFATLQVSPNDPGVAAVWGTNGDKLLVDEGDLVFAGQPIGKAGTTGAHSGGVHLHLMFARPAVHRVNGASVNRWTFFDPYGIYALDLNCYRIEYPSGEGGEARQHPSVIAPFRRVFTGASSSLFQHGFDYFAHLGWFPQALASENVPGQGYRMAGVFALDPEGPAVRHLRTFSQHQADFEYWRDRGWRPRQQTVVTGSGATRYSTIYAPIDATFWTSHKMGTTWFNDEWDERYADWEMVDVAPYNENGVLYFTAMWLRRSHDGYAMRYGLDAAGFAARHEQYTGAGLRIRRLQAYDHPGAGRRYAALWERDPSPAFFLRDLSASLFQAYTEMHLRLGRRIVHVSAHDGLYSMIYE
jgi:murein DD-endopeptidase MepM/ murein hydrolase activator NlpD